MMLAFKFFSNPITFSSKEIPVIVIENKKLFRKIIESFELDYSEEFFTFSESYTPISFSKTGIFISDLFNVDMNNKRLLAKVTRYLEENANVEFVNELEHLIADLISFGDRLCGFADFDCEFNYDISSADIIKLLSFRLGAEATNPADKLISFIMLMNRYLNIRLFVIPHMHILFDTDELSLIYETLSLNHINLLSIECVEPLGKSNGEILYIVDKDLCFIDNSRE